MSLSKGERKDRLGTEPYRYVEQQYDLEVVCAVALYTNSALLLPDGNCRQCTRGYAGLQLTFFTATVMVCSMFLLSFLLYSHRKFRFWALCLFLQHYLLVSYADDS